MDDRQERRKEKRLYYNWPISFCREFDKEFLQGEIFNISSTHIAFSCRTKYCPADDEIAVIRFSVPRYDPNSSFQKKEFTFIGTVSNAHLLNPYTRLVVLKFEKPLPFKPGEQLINI